MIEGKPGKEHSQRVQNLPVRFRVLRAERRLQQREIGAAAAHRLDAVFRAAMQKAHGLQRERNVISEAVLPVPRAAAGENARIGAAQDRLIVVDHDGAFAEDRAPEAGMRAFAGSAWRGEEVGFPVQSDGGAVNRHRPELREPLGGKPVERIEFQLRIAASFGLLPAAQRRAAEKLPLGFDRRPVDLHGEDGRIIRPIRGAERRRFRICDAGAKRNARELQNQLH